MIYPINCHYQIRPISKVQEGPMATAEKNYDEKGVVLSCPSDAFLNVPEGATVYFDAWQASKFNTDTAEEFWLVPSEAIRAYEIPEVGV